MECSDFKKDGIEDSKLRVKIDFFHYFFKTAFLLDRLNNLQILSMSRSGTLWINRGRLQTDFSWYSDVNIKKWKKFRAIVRTFSQNFHLKQPQKTSGVQKTSLFVYRNILKERIWKVVISYDFYRLAQKFFQQCRLSWSVWQLLSVAEIAIVMRF